MTTELMSYGSTVDECEDAAANRVPFGTLAYIGAFLSLLACYGQVFFVTAIGSFGFQDAGINPHLQAVLMWSLGVIAIYGLYRDRGVHGKSHPLIIGSLGVGIIIATLYTHYSQTLEVSGYILLVISALLNQNARLLQLNEAVGAQSELLSQQASKLAAHNRGLELRVDSQDDEIEKLARLKQFLAPEVAQIVLAEQQGVGLQSHRCYIVALFCDIRGFTRFSERTEPEEVIQVLQEYHGVMGQLVAEHGGTIDHRAGDGLMVFFNDPIPCDAPEMRAVALAQAMRQRFRECNRDWHRHGYRLGFGIGIAAGYATLGIVGYQDRYDYTANGNVVNLASRLCDSAEDGQILVSGKTYALLDEAVDAQCLEDLELQGIAKPVTAYALGE